MRAYRLLWGAAFAVLTAAAVTTMVERSEPSQILSLVVALGSLGAVLGVGWGSELTTLRHPVLVGTGAGAVASLALPGLLALAGWWAGPACVLLAISSPYAWGRLRARALVVTDPGAPMDEETQVLRRDWEATTRALAAGPTVKDHLLLAQLRGCLLVEIRAHHAGVLPAYVWAPLPDEREPDGREHSGPGPRDLEP